MVIKLIIELIAGGLLSLYYFTVFLHLMGVKIFKKAEISPLVALIPFYYWFKREVTV
jgi:hypothetical protein